MDFIRKAGKKFEETKQSVVGGSSSEYVCQACEQAVAENYEHCPHCGDGPITSVE